VKGKVFRSVFWAMIAFFVLTIGVTVANGYVHGTSIGYLILSFWTIFSGLGILLVILTLRQKVPGALKVFLLLAGSSAGGFAVFVILHNVISGLFNVEEGVFFVLATIVCPLGFLAGIIGSVIIDLRNKTRLPLVT
jgi:hypothetical protein